jgi:carboxylate-amine ligase
MKPPSLTIGIEEEYQIIDPHTRELKSYITQLLEESKLILREQVKAEMHQSMVEVGTEVCRTPAEARAELVRLRREVIGLAGARGLRIAAAGTHPFSSWLQQEITPLERYLGVKQDMQDLAQQLLIFGTHVHIGIEDREFLVDAMNVARYFVPHVLCLAASSPFWMGRNTGLKSYRNIIFRHFPRSGIPPVFSSWGELTYLVDTLVRTNCIPDGTKLWWDVRPNWKYPTLEFRVCDVCTRVDEAVCVAALFQALVAKLWKLRRDNLTFRVYPTALVDENKWRAVRDGLDADLIWLERDEERPAREALRHLVELAEPAARRLGCAAELALVEDVLRRGTGADEQRRVQADGESLLAVAQFLARTTTEALTS